MKDQKDQAKAKSNTTQDNEFNRYKQKRLIAAVLIAVILVWGLSAVLVFFKDSPANRHASSGSSLEASHTSTKPLPPIPTAAPQVEAQKTVGSATPPYTSAPAPPPRQAALLGHTPLPVYPEDEPAPSQHAEESAHGAIDTRESMENLAPGVALVMALKHPMNHELSTGWGWRPNDIVNITDNVNNYQLGVLEVTRRTTDVLAKRLSRTGHADAFDTNLQNAMNWFMIKASSLYLPSAEKKYGEGLLELAKYKKRLENGQAKFFTRPDNLIPLLMEYKDLLGSCDENLAKEKEEDGSMVSTFAADDYFYYAKGVASAMHGILEAVAIDFKGTITARHGMVPLEHALHNLARAQNMSPLLITEGSYSGILANHRANMAAPISHARFYLGVLITTLST